MAIQRPPNLDSNMQRKAKRVNKAKEDHIFPPRGESANQEGAQVRDNNERADLALRT